LVLTCEGSYEEIVLNFSAYPTKNAGSSVIPIPTSTTAGCLISWSSFNAKETLPCTNQATDYAPGDLVTRDLGRGIPHIGIVVDEKAGGSNRYMAVHNIGAGPKMEDVLFAWKITGHYRYFGPASSH
jgi:uncharacterized protein YijF (DUF1287 family)